MDDSHIFQLPIEKQLRARITALESEAATLRAQATAFFENGVSKEVHARAVDQCNKQAETIRLLREENEYLKSAAHYAPASDDLIDVVSGALRLHKKSIGIRQYGPLVERARVLRDRCAKMVKALEWYAQPGEFFVDAVKDYTNGGSTLSVFFDDNGERAREALRDGDR
jgi:hypothetical protein